MAKADKTDDGTVRRHLLVGWLGLLVFLALGEAIVTTRLAMQDRYDAAVRIDRVARWVYLGLFIAALVAHLVVGAVGVRS